MTEATLTYKHPISCAGNKPKQPKIPKIKTIEPVEEIEDIEDIEDEILAAPPTIQPLKRSTSLCPMAARQIKINQKKEQFKAFVANAINKFHNSLLPSRFTKLSLNPESDSLWISTM